MIFFSELEDFRIRFFNKVNMDYTMKIVLDEFDEDEEDVYWSMNFIFDNELCSFSFFIAEPFIASLEEWRNISNGGTLSFCDGCIRVTDTHFEFVALSGCDGNVNSTNRLKKDVVAGPLDEAINEAVVRGYFGEEEKENYMSSRIKGDY